MGFLTWIVLGLIVGILAKFIMPGKDPGGIILTICLGITGAFIGGFFGNLIGIGTVSGFNLVSFTLATLGSIVLLVIFRTVKR